MWCPVGMHKWSRNISLQLDNGEAQSGDSETSWSIDGAIPLELWGSGQAELVGKVASLVMVIAVLMLVQRQDIGAILVLVGPVFTLLAQFEHIVEIYP